MTLHHDLADKSSIRDRRPHRAVAGNSGKDEKAARPAHSNAIHACVCLNERWHARAFRAFAGHKLIEGNSARARCPLWDYAAGGARARNESLILTGGISTAINGRHTGRTGSGTTRIGAADVLPVANSAMVAQIGQ